MRFGQQRQILALVFVPTLLSLVLLGFVLRDSLHQWAIDRWSNDHHALVSALDRQLDAHIDRASALIRFAARSAEFSSLPERRHIDRALNGLPENLDTGKRHLLEWLRTQGGFSVLFVLTPEGDHYISHPFTVQRSLKKFNLAERPYFQKARDTRELVVSDSFIGADGIPAIAIDVPVTDAQGKIILHLGGVLHLTHLSTLLARSAIAPFDHAALVDRQGNRVADSNPALLAKDAGEPLISHPNFKAINTDDARLPEEMHKIHVNRSIDGTGTRWVNFDMMMENGWHLFLFRLESSLQEEIEPQVRRATLVAAGILLLPSLLGLFMALRFSRRWHRADLALRESNATLEKRIEERTAELQKSETRHRILFESTADAVLILSEKEFVDCNDAAVKIFGARSRDDVLAAHPSDLSPKTQGNGEDSRVVADRMIEKALTEGSCSFEWHHRRLDTGKAFIAKVLLSRMEVDGQVLIQASVRDVTESIQIKQQLEDQKAHLEELVEQRTIDLSRALNAAKLADQTKDAFLANMSHELRTPLNAVIGMAGLARNLSTEPKQRDYLDKITISGKHLNRIINDLLDLSKIAAGHMEFETVTFSLRGLIRSGISVMAHRAAEKGLELTESIDDAVPDVVRGDPMRIEQILLNLVGNGIKFTQTGRVDVHLSLHAHEGIDVCLDIDVKDTGIGMRPEDLERLFKPFSQADATVSRKYGGTGLGLTISRRLAEMMGGNVSVTSIEGSGTTFKVRLWLSQGNSGDLPATAPISNEALPVNYKNASVLVVDDQPLNREIVEALLAAVGITARTAADGQEALDILSESGPVAFDVVLMDVQMPVLDGLTATRMLRSRPGFGSLPIVAMTAHTMAHEQEISFAAGMSDHIGKPFDNASFYYTLAKWIPNSKQIVAQMSALLTSQPEPVAAARTELCTLRDVDVSAALTRFGGKEARYRHWLSDFVVTAGAVPDQIRHEIAAGQSDNAIKMAHTFKGRVGMLGMTELHRIVSEMELALREGGPSNDLLLKLGQSISDMCEQVSRALNTSATVKTSDKHSVGALVWNDTYSVGVAAMDEQHKKLIGMINQLADCHTAQSSNLLGAFHQLLSNMFDYTQIHFKAEEDYLQGIGYPHLAVHQEEHAAFIERMTAYSMKASEGIQDCSGAYHFMKEWLLSHILKSDMQYRYFAERCNL